MVSRQAVSELPSGRYDLITDDGRYYHDVMLKGGETHLHNRPIAQAMSVTGLKRMPWLGVLLRNMWAKQRGARIVPELEVKDDVE